MGIEIGKRDAFSNFEIRHRANECAREYEYVYVHRKVFASPRIYELKRSGDEEQKSARKVATKTLK